jgi:hypothetical protein
VFPKGIIVRACWCALGDEPWVCPCANIVGTEEGKVEELRREEPKTSEIAQTIEISIVISPIDSVVLSNESNPSHQSVHSTVNSSPPHIQSRTLGRSMAGEMRLPIFRGDGSKYPDQHWFLCEVVWDIKNVTDEAVKRT